MQTEIREEKQVLEPDQTALLSVRFSWVQNSPSSQAHTLHPIYVISLP